MPRTEARVFTSIWGDADFRRLSGDAQRVYLLLLSQSDLTQAGTLSLSLKRWAGMSASGTLVGVQGSLDELEAARFVLVDYETEEVLLRSLLRRDGAWKSYKTLTYAVRAAESVLSQRLRAALLVEVQRIDPSGLDDSRGNRTKVEAHLALLRATLGGPLDSPPGDRADTPSYQRQDTPSRDRQRTPGSPLGMGLGLGQSVRSPESSSSSSVDDDDKIAQGMTAILGAAVDRVWAIRVREQVLQGREVKRPVPYVLRAVQEDPSRFRPPLRLVSGRPAWCGSCQSDGLRVVEVDGDIKPCPTCGRRTA